ncbi:MAG: beta-glucuronidase [Chitinophagaceae bacterium]
MKTSLFILLSVVLSVAGYGQTISLEGSWKFAVDREDAGIKEQWYAKTLGADSVRLPGSMLTNGKGDAVTLQTKWTGSIYDSSWFFNPRLAKYRQPGDLKFPFWLTPARYYVGAAWYQKEVTIPASWTQQHISLFLERCHTETIVWVDGKEAGMQNSMVAPHEYDLTKYLSPGKHIITIRIDNRIKAINVGPDSHSLTDHTEGNWNGIIGDLELRATPLVWISDVQVYPDVQQKTARVVITLKSKAAAKGTMSVSAKSFNSNIAHTVQPVNGIFEMSADTAAAFQTEVVLPMTDKVQLWDEFNPALYKLHVVLQTNQKETDTRDVQFGMRVFGIQGTNFTINGRPVFLRGTVNNCEFPLTGFPPMDVAAWERLFITAKSYGLNHMRFHSWCPPEAAFIAADKTGFYLQPEGPSWPNHGTSIGDGKPVDKFIYEETDRMAARYGNYASFCMMAAGNEPAGRNQAKYLGEFVRYWQAKDKRRVYTGASVAMSWPLVPENDYMVKSGPRGLSWSNSEPESNSDYHSAIEKFNVPYVTHEMGQWCVFPDFKEIDLYTGVYKAKNFEMFRQDLADHGMDTMAQSFLMASGKLQALCYKNEIEKTLRTKGLAGFQLLGLQDFPGQGTALVGVLNAFWKSKGYITAEQFKRFCNATVPLIRTGKFVYTNNEQLNAAVEIYHYGAKPLQQAVVKWKLTDNKGQVIAQQQFAPQDIPVGNANIVGNIQADLSKITVATQLKLEVTIDKTVFANDWDFWIYPSALPEVKGGSVYYTDTLDTRASYVLQRGGKVFLYAAGKVTKGKEVVNYATPVFWNTSWFKMRPPHTLGFVCNPQHPAFADFPTEYHSNLQWWEIVNRSQVMHLEDFPKNFKPLLQPIDTWFMNRKLAIVLEAKVGGGKLLICSADLKNNLDKRPAARQLLYSLQKYVASDKFNPQQIITIEMARDLFTQPSRETWDAYTKDSPDELKPKSQLQQ